MAGSTLNDFLRRLTRGMAANTLADQSDRQLVERFLDSRDAAAFEAIVRRHGPMVYRVCWRVVQQDQDAEDAFQATFLLLAQKLGSVRRRASLAPWLHGVAHRVALKARARAATRRRHEDRARVCPAVPPDDVTWGELRLVLDAELARLPERWRLPLILCCLEGRTQDEAAGHLGWSKNTLRRRLDEARAALGRRLTRRGVVWPAALSAVLLSDCVTPAALPPGLIGSTVEAAARIAAGQAVTTAAASATVAALTEGMRDAMYTSKLNAVAALLLLAGALATGMGFLGTAGWTAQGQEPGRGNAEARKTAPKAPPASEPRAGVGKGRLLFYRAGHLTLIGPDGQDEHRVSKDRGEFMPGEAWLSPDGRRIAFLVQVDKEPKAGRDPRRKVYVRGLDEPEPGTDLGIEGQHVCWSPDGTQLLVGDFVHGPEPKNLKFAHRLVDVRTRQKTAVPLPDNHFVQDWSRDGKHLLTEEMELEKRRSRLVLLNRDGTGARPLTDGRQLVFGGRLSPDVRKVLYLAPDPERQGKEGLAGQGLFVLDVPSGKSRRVEQQPLNGEVQGLCWSPDGRRIAYAWRQVHDKEEPHQETTSCLVVADADGKNPITLATEKGDSAGLLTIAGIDWR